MEEKCLEKRRKKKISNNDDDDDYEKIGTDYHVVVYNSQIKYIYCIIMMIE